MNSQDPAANNPSDQPQVIVLDEFASIEKSLEGHPQRSCDFGENSGVSISAFTAKSE